MGGTPGEPRLARPPQSLTALVPEFALLGSGVQHFIERLADNRRVRVRHHEVPLAALVVAKPGEPRVAFDTHAAGTRAGAQFGSGRALRSADHLDHDAGLESEAGIVTRDLRGGGDIAFLR